MGGLGLKTSEGDQAKACGTRHRFGARVGVQFAEDRVHVELDGVAADAEAAGNLPVRQAF